MQDVGEPDRRRTDRRSARAHPLAHALDLALAGGGAGVELLFQPQYDCASGAVVGAEALARWQPPGRSAMAGDVLCAIGARSGLGPRLARHVVGYALAAARAWPEHLQVSLNLHPGDLADQGLVTMVEDALHESGMDPRRLTLEITEQALVNDLEQSAASLQRLSDRGIRIALDDFGAGFCNFQYLKLLPLDCLKLDRSMIEGVTDSERDLAVLRGIVAMASALGLRVTAEGIETEAQRRVVVAEGCAAWQGFLGSRPVSAEAFAGLAAD